MLCTLINLVLLSTSSTKCSTLSYIFSTLNTAELDLNLGTEKRVNSIQSSELQIFPKPFSRPSKIELLNCLIPDCFTHLVTLDRINNFWLALGLVSNETMGSIWERCQTHALMIQSVHDPWLSSPNTRDECRYMRDTSAVRRPMSLMKTRKAMLMIHEFTLRKNAVPAAGPGSLQLMMTSFGLIF
jgi:hypothetical protein